MRFATQKEYVAYLEARVESLEAALRQRSRVYRRIQRHASARDLLLISRIESGLPPLPRQAFDLSLWRETTELTAADVEETMQDLWRSLQPIADDLEAPSLEDELP